METMRYLQNTKSKFFQKQYAMYTAEGYVFPAVPEGFEVVDTEEARQWDRDAITRREENMAAYYEKNTTRFD
jgi:hypothetical protein